MDLKKPMSALVADAIPRDLTLTALAAMPLDRLATLARDIADVCDRLDAVCALHGIQLEETQ